ncbi:hypothetical protein D3C86_2218170 [compost metagenome]
MVTFGLDKDAVVDLDAVTIEVPMSDYGTQETAPGLGAPAPDAAPAAEEDPNKAIMESMKQEQGK